VASETSELDLGNTSNACRREDRDEDEDDDDDFAAGVSANISKSRVSTGRYDLDDDWEVEDGRRDEGLGHPLKAMRYARKKRRRDHSCSFDELDGKTEGGGGDWDYDDWKIRRMFSGGSEQSASTISISKPSTSRCWMRREWHRRRAAAAAASSSSSKDQQSRLSSRGVTPLTITISNIGTPRSQSAIDDGSGYKTNSVSRTNTPFTDRNSGRVMEVQEVDRSTSALGELDTRGGRSPQSPTEDAKLKSGRSSDEKDNSTNVTSLLSSPVSMRHDRKGKQKIGSTPLAVFSETRDKTRPESTLIHSVV
jgi:hypothetical protein